MRPQREEGLNGITGLCFLVTTTVSVRNLSDRFSSLTQYSCLQNVVCLFSLLTGLWERVHRVFGVSRN